MAASTERGAHSSFARLCATLGAIGIVLVACDRPDRAPLAPAPPRAEADIAPPSCPEEMARVAVESRFVCVDKYEASVVGHPFSEPFAEGLSVPAAKPAKGLKPQVNISEPAAEAACEASSKRLCTAAEWTAACQGPEGFAYPYGNEHVVGACNEGRPSPVKAVLGPAGGRLDNPKLAEAPNGIQPGGSFPKCVSASGAFDMHGNVHEWVSDSPKPDDPRFGMFVGGFFAEASANGEGCLYKTTAHFKTYYDYSIGFRCCSDPTGGAPHDASADPGGAP